MYLCETDPEIRETGPAAREPRLPAAAALSGEEPPAAEIPEAHKEAHAARKPRLPAAAALGGGDPPAAEIPEAHKEARAARERDGGFLIGPDAGNSPGRKRTYKADSLNNPPYFSEPAENILSPGPGFFAALAPTEEPPAAPPPRIPSKTACARQSAVNARAVRGCVGKHTYIWLKNGAGFWLYPTYSGKRSLSGYRWTLRGWTLSGVILDWIDFFQCV